MFTKSIVKGAVLLWSWTIYSKEHPEHLYFGSTLTRQGATFNMWRFRRKILKALKNQ
jgi:hypothetical protein